MRRTSASDTDGSELRVASFGDTLRAARLARGLTLEQVEAATRIRVRFLAALESERFELIPGDAYVRVFVREYATLLGLDARPLLAELDGRRGDDEPVQLVLPSSSGERRRLSWGKPVALLVLAAIALAVWKLGMPRSGHTSAATTAASATVPHRPAHPAQLANRPQPKRPKPPPRKPVKRAPAVSGVLLAASRGPCWLLVRAGSASGPQLYQGLLARGGKLHYARARVWLRVGAPVNLSIQVNGKSLALPATRNPLNVVVTPARLIRA